MRYRCPQKKEELVNIIANEFERVKNDLDSHNTPENYGRYQAMMDLLQKIHIFEED